MRKVILLGAGLVGKAIAIDLHKQYDVTVVDIAAKALNALNDLHKIKTIRADLSDSTAVKSIVKDFDIVIGAVPGHMGYKLVKNVITAGKDIVDISFFPEDPFTLDELAKKQNVTAVVDCGLAPGMGNLILGYHQGQMTVTSFKCLVGGLPVIREWPFEYKAVFSPLDVIEEYIRPARFVENGNIVIKEPLTDPELVYFDRVGTLEAWNTDGLRTLIRTMDIPDMIEKTLRYPGTIEYVKVLRESGFFSTKEIEINGYPVRPLDLTGKLLTSKWKLSPGEEDLTVMRITITGSHKGEKKTYTYELFDRYDKTTRTLSMARTTGYTCTAVAGLLLRGKIKRKGICPPEYVGSDPENFNFVLNYLRDRGVVYKITTIFDET
ncbi:MAG: saccharopine dehydrogenase [FCB group bacterium]|nr:saccharopine dehydrogenase [FCB group bacterium]